MGSRSWRGAADEIDRMRAEHESCISRLVADEYDKWHKGSFTKLEKMHFASFLIILHRSRVHRSIGVIPIPLEKPEMCLSPISSPLGERWHLWNFTSAFNHSKAARTESAVDRGRMWLLLKIADRSPVRQETLVRRSMIVVGDSSSRAMQMQWEPVWVPSSP